MTEPKKLVIVTRGPKTLDQLDRDTREFAQLFIERGDEVTLVDATATPLTGQSAELMIIDDPHAEIDSYSWPDDDIVWAARGLGGIPLDGRRFMAPAQPRVEKSRPHWQQLNGGDTPWKRKRK